MARSFPIRIFGILAIAGGTARIVASFIPWRADDAALEVFYLGIDLALLFGLIGFYFLHAARLGRVGLVGFLVAASGIALITVLMEKRLEPIFTRLGW